MKNSVPPIDAAVRQEALTPDQSYIVQAPAGSGKTELLTQRYLSLLARVDEPEEVLAITFTRKAAAEMRNRVLSAIESAQSGTIPIKDTPHKRFTRELGRAVLERSRERGWDLLRTPGRVRIQTIDSFCAATVNQVPMQAGFGATSEIAEEDTRRQQLYAQAALNTIKLLLVPGHERSGAMQRALMHLDNNVGLVVTLVSEMLHTRDQWERYVSRQRDPYLRQQFEGVLKKIVEDALRKTREYVPKAYASELMALIAIADANLSSEDRENRLAAMHGMMSLPGYEASDLERWRAIQWFLLTDKRWRKRCNVTTGFPATGKKEKQRCEALLQALSSEAHEEFRTALGMLGELPATSFEDSQWEVLEALLVILPGAIDELKNLFRQNAVTDFIEVSQGALKALESGKSQPFKHLLVDEFQDTSVMQWRILKALITDWKANDKRTVFLVGDPMQSIYRFRQAEVGLFIQARQNGLGKLKPKPLSLQVNFRSDTALVEWFNARFCGVFGDTDDFARGTVSFNKCFAAPESANGASPAVHWATDPQDEAGQTLAIIREALNSDGSIAILVRARTHLPAIVETLRRASIPFEAVEIQKLSERPLVRDLLMLTRALLHPADRLAWIAVLRAPWSGLTLNDLHALCGHDLNSAIWDCMNGDISALTEDGRARVERIRQTITAALQKRLRVPLREWIEGTWISLGGPACITDAADLENAEAFFELLEGAPSAGNLNPEDSAAAVENLFAKTQNNEEVRIHVMTIHKAKGLEFDTVIVPGLGRSAQKDTARLLQWEERATESGTELLLAPITEKGAENDPIYSYLRHSESLRKKEENKRLLYVAVTRAKRNLHLIAVPKLKKDGELSERGSLLQFLWPDLKAEFHGSVAETRVLAANEERRTLDIAAAEERPPIMLRRLPADWNVPTSPVPLKWVSENGFSQVPDGERITYDWVGEKLRHIGSVLHAMTQRIAKDGLKCWPAERIRQTRSLYKAALAERGLGSSELDDAAIQVEQALIELTSDERGRWTLETHSEAQSEYALSGILKGSRVEHFKLDRTFIDEQGIRWIIDYKTARHEGSDREGFLDNEKLRYKEQLENYARLFQHLEPERPMRVGLYFPLLREWREWEPEIEPRVIEP